MTSTGPFIMESRSTFEPRNEWSNTSSTLTKSCSLWSSWLMNKLLLPFQKKRHINNKLQELWKLLTECSQLWAIELWECLPSSFEKSGERFTITSSSIQTKSSSSKSLSIKEKEIWFYVQPIDHISISSLYHTYFSISKWKFHTYAQVKTSWMLLWFIIFWDSLEPSSWNEVSEMILFIRQSSILMSKSWWRMEMPLNSLLRELDQELEKCLNQNLDFWLFCLTHFMIDLSTTFNLYLWVSTTLEYLKLKVIQENCLESKR